MPSDVAIHSDLLVYWTGAKDIEVDCGTSDWHKEHRPKHAEKLTTAYVKRLENILKYGLWMTNQSPPSIDGIHLEDVPCACFTELKLSESLTHATQYGRLGVAFKRPFLFVRGGRPVVYYGAPVLDWVKRDKFLQACAEDLRDKRLMHFFKPMNSGKQLTYDLYSESEWRIVFDEELLRSGTIVDPRNATNSESFGYFQSLLPQEQAKLRYLVPVDGWLALIISAML